MKFFWTTFFSCSRTSCLFLDNFFFLFAPRRHPWRRTLRRCCALDVSSSPLAQSRCDVVQCAPGEVRARTGLRDSHGRTPFLWTSPAAAAPARCRPHCPSLVDTRRCSWSSPPASARPPRASRSAASSPSPALLTLSKLLL